MIKHARMKDNYDIEDITDEMKELFDTALMVKEEGACLNSGPFKGQPVWRIVEPEYLSNGFKINGMWIPECDLNLGDEVVIH